MKSSKHNFILNLNSHKSHHLHSMFHSFPGLRSTQQIGLLPMYGLHSSAGRTPKAPSNVEAMGSNPVEVPKFFQVNLQLHKLQLPLR